MEWEPLGEDIVHLVFQTPFFPLDVPCSTCLSTKGLPYCRNQHCNKIYVFNIVVISATLVEFAGSWMHVLHVSLGVGSLG